MRKKENLIRASPSSLRLIGAYVGEEIDTSGIENREKSNRYWLSFENVKAEAEKIIAEYGYLPGKGELSKNGYNSFAQSVIKHHGGFRTLRTKLGIGQVKGEPGNWKNWRKVKAKLEHEIEGLLNNYPNEFRDIP